jgi:hypothetical protein
MRLLSMLRGSRRATLRVSADGGPAEFDALLLFEGGRRPETRVLTAERTPFALELPDEDVTVVVRPRDRARSIVAEYAREVGGRRVLWGRSWMPTPVLRRLGGVIVCAGVPAAGDAG